MTPAEAAALLTIAAAFDNRKPDADTAKAWALALDGLRFEDCREVVVEHYRKSRDWLMPADVIGGVKRLRAARLAATVEPNPPPDLEPRDYAEWLRDVRRQIADGTYRAEPPRMAPRLTDADRERISNLMPTVTYHARATTIPVRGAEQHTTQEDA